MYRSSHDKIIDNACIIMYVYIVVHTVCAMCVRLTTHKSSDAAERCLNHVTGSCLRAAVTATS